MNQRTKKVRIIDAQSGEALICTSYHRLNTNPGPVTRLAIATNPHFIGASWFESGDLLVWRRCRMSLASFYLMMAAHWRFVDHHFHFADVPPVLP
ncbi:hypothetical protein HAX54_043128 [Datura stramonium]|uniref:Uncharacterized protein n=1 Tax=Datura stramonium TaxID=4076 RepID=A0ABS8W3D0_DATST|nr:hypothetical protein [Datura stramonium]